MPAKDKFHQAVKQALFADGWRITDDPLSIIFVYDADQEVIVEWIN